MKWVWTIVFSMGVHTCNAQNNLVPNPSFEDSVYCPYTPGQINATEAWFSVRGSIDYYHTCGTNGYGVPNNLVGVQSAKEGRAYIGIALWALVIENGREYVSVELLEQLEPEKRYLLEMHVSLADSLHYSVKNIGIHLSSHILSSDINSLLNITPQIQYSDTAFLSDRTGWVSISGQYIASGGERFITIGNFDDDAETSTFYVGPINGNQSVWRYLAIMSMMFRWFKTPATMLGCWRRADPRWKLGFIQTPPRV